MVVLYSMTGYGEASYSSDLLQVAIELRAVNNRYLKVSLRAAEPYNLLEPEFEKVVRRTVKRGTIQVHLRCLRQFAAQDFQINAVALRSYLGQLRPSRPSWPGRRRPDAAGQVLALPGVVPEPASASLDLEEEWPVLERVLEQALAQLAGDAAGRGPGHGPGTAASSATGSPASSSRSAQRGAGRGRGVPRSDAGARAGAAG